MFGYILGPLLTGVFGFFCAMELDNGDGWLQLGALILVAIAGGFAITFTAQNFSHPLRTYSVMFTLGALVWVATGIIHGA